MSVYSILFSCLFLEGCTLLTASSVNIGLSMLSVELASAGLTLLCLLLTAGILVNLNFTLMGFVYELILKLEMVVDLAAMG